MRREYHKMITALLDSRLDLKKYLLLIWLEFLWIFLWRKSEKRILLTESNAYFAQRGKRNEANARRAHPFVRDTREFPRARARPTPEDPQTARYITDRDRPTNSSCRRHHRREREWIKEVIIRDVTRLVSTPDPSATSRGEFESSGKWAREGPSLRRPLRRNYASRVEDARGWKKCNFPTHPGGRR